MKGQPWGGSEELWARSAMRMARAGHRIDASIAYWPSPAAGVRQLGDAGVEVHMRNYRRPASLALKALGRDPELWRAVRFIRSSGPELVVISCGGFAEDVWWGTACQTLGVPYVVVAQAASEGWWPRDDDQTRAIRTFYEAALRVFFVSRGNQRLVESMLGKRIPNARVVRNPFNVNYHAACPYPSPHATLHLACVARLEPLAKGQDLLLDVLRQQKWRERDIAVRFYGTGPNAHGLASLADLYEITNVEFRGHVDGIENVWRDNHILVLPSRLEGLPLALVEAMLCARPAIVTDVAGNGEVVDDEETGFVAAAATVAHLDEAMERAWTRRHDWAAMGEEAARRIRRKIPEDPVEGFMSELSAAMSFAAPKHCGNTRHQA